MKQLILMSAALLCSSAALATSKAAVEPVTMNVVSESGVGAAIGTVTVEETPYGVVFTPALTGLAPGVHGFHVHEKGSCAPEKKDGKMVPALAAGGHYDPEKTGKHGLPWGSGHKGDLPALVVDTKGAATMPVLAPRLKLADIKGKALMIHAGGDNHSDHPAPLGGGGARMACAVIK
ncbi:superoxide dismutase family protein [Massilia sp. PAMC28688]|uniref:superoxide dismutase family protein n=1 Tax=Massilia sp. PAMC28688 TaxID=2861283 RepID=UPI001C627401|nr:superoxide dismutase family protein [Massilia sp. PAMC28688]QYF94913.1 superoxide dismutase family protein [Massilia sp. PAMC28688]